MYSTIYFKLFYIMMYDVCHVFFVHYTAVRSAGFDIVCFISLVVVLFLIHSLALVTINVYSNNCNAAPNAPLTKLSTTKVSTCTREQQENNKRTIKGQLKEEKRQQKYEATQCMFLTSIAPM